MANAQNLYGDVLGVMGSVSQNELEKKGQKSWHMAH